MTLKEIGKSVGNAVLKQAGRISSRVQENRSLPADLLESEDAYLIVFDAPGATQSDVQVRFVDGAVLVRLDRFREFYEGYEMRFPGRGMALDGRVELPEDAVVDAAAATATLTDSGTLHVEVPKREDPGDEISVEEETAGDEEEAEADEAAADDTAEDADADTDEDDEPTA